MYTDKIPMLGKLDIKLIFFTLAIILGIGAFVFLLFKYFSWDRGPITPGQKVTVSRDGQNTATSEVDYSVEPFVANLSIPWSMVFSAPERVLVTERAGTIKEIVSGKLNTNALISFSEVAAEGEAGLMGMALHPDYSSNKYVYVCMAYDSDDGIRDKVERLVDNGNEIVRDRIIIENIPAAQFHAGCRINFGPDNKLYITTGDASSKNLAQDKNSLAGKILRINDDGTIPNDNPFGNAIWSLGHRNPQGIAWHSSGVMFATEHGPSGFDGPGGGDELNVIKKGTNYGWPLVSHDKSQEGMESPKLVFTPAEAPSGALFYTGDVFPQFKNNFFFTALKGEGLFSVVVNNQDASEILSYEKLDIDVGRVRDVIEGPDGLIYFATSNRDGRGNAQDGDDKIYRLEPK